MTALTIGQLAKRAQVNVETVRYYERQGLIPTPGRSASGYRQYTQETAARIRFIRRAKELGFSLREIGALLSLEGNPDTACAEVKERAEVKLADIEERIRDLERIKRVLASLLAACPEHGSTSHCPILKTMTDGAETVAIDAAYR